MPRSPASSSDLLPHRLHCDIFCRVIDNLGDAGVCWRLARQLAVEHAWQVRLFIDDPRPISLLAPSRTDVDVRQWTADFPESEPADAVIEAFACTLPDSYIAAMRARHRPPVWLNLEYLSAEPWVAGCHGLPSPQAGLQKYFFFPGFVPGTGGLVRERDFTVPPAPSFADRLEVSLFSYANPALPTLLDAWRDDQAPIRCHVAEGLPRQQVERWLGQTFECGNTVERGSLTLSALPFLPQSQYDALLGRCHLNFVRGEDSFVRAQWAERPFVWQAYPQADDAHLAKLDAFLDLYEPGPSTEHFFAAWNGRDQIDWPALRDALPALAVRAQAWSQRIAAQGDLASNLVKFCTLKL